METILLIELTERHSFNCITAQLHQELANWSTSSKGYFLDDGVGAELISNLSVDVCICSAVERNQAVKYSP